MRLKQLHQYLGELIAANIDPDTIVCIHEDTEMELFEVDGVELVDGPYREDPSPLMPGPLARNGRVILLTATGLDYAPLERWHTTVDLPVEAPEKSWPNGWGK